MLAHRGRMQARSECGEESECGLYRFSHPRAYGSLAPAAMASEPWCGVRSRRLSDEAVDVPRITYRSCVFLHERPVYHIGIFATCRRRGIVQVRGGGGGRYRLGYLGLSAYQSESRGRRSRSWGTCRFAPRVVTGAPPLLYFPMTAWKPRYKCARDTCHAQW